MRRLAFITTVGLLLAACKDDANSDEDGADTSGGSVDDGSDPTGSPSSTTMPSSTTDPIDCVPGAEDCECLDGECIGEFMCIEGLCKPGPLFEGDDEDPEVLAGLVVPINVDVTADEFSWSQVDGPATEIIGEGPSILVPVPPDAAAGEVITLRITAVRNTIQATFDVRIVVREAVFEDFLAGITSIEELGTSEGIDFDDNGNMWVVSTEGFISRFGVDATFQSRVDVPGQPVGALFGRYFEPMVDDQDPIDVLFVANAMNASIERVNTNSGAVTLVSDTVEGGGTIGTANFVLPDGDGNVYVSNRTGGQVFRYDGYDGVTRLLVDLPGANPNALSFGPDANVLYVGTIGQVLRVGVLPDETAAEPEVYLDFADVASGWEADGLAFDEGGNLWVGAPNGSTLYLARYAGTGPTTVIREFADVGANISYFTSLRFGNGGFGDSVLYWTGLANRTVGRLETGLNRL